jgi:energy-coupling factor transporter ATP-binding protein EcfA2
MFNFQKARQNAVKDLTNQKLGVLVLGPGGSGKSTVCGSFEGKVLYLYTSGESHGVLSATSSGSEIFGIRLDQGDDGKQLKPDEAYDRLLAILSDEEGVRKEGFSAVVLDSLMEIESLVRTTNKFKALCLTDKGAVNRFAEPQSVLDMLRPILVKLKDLQLNAGIHYAVTCPLHVSEIGDNGEILQAGPKLSTYSVAEGLILQFPDIVVISRMTNDKGVPGYRFQFNSSVSKESKDKDGTVKKLLNFSPRLAGIREIPTTMPADMKKLAELKAKLTAKASLAAVADSN